MDQYRVLIYSVFLMCQEKDKVSSTILKYYRNELFKPFWEDGRGILGIHGNGYRNETYTQS